MSVQMKATIASFGGKLLKLAHNASTTNCEMAFNLYLPPQTTTNSLHKVPLLIYLAGLTCTGDNGAEKGFFQHAASQKGIAILYPDTSPRACPICPNAHGAFADIKGDQVALKLKAKTSPTTSAAAQASTSTPPNRRGRRGIRCIAISRKNCRRRCSRISRRLIVRGLAFLDIVWVGMVR